ncbi:amidohydrolase [Klebsiella pneumoniae]|nr:amidohydrolase [Klebsiella pneumoniae]
MSSKYRTTLNVKRLTEFRHDLHMHPELKFMEHRTSDKIAAFLTELDIPYKRGLASTGIVGSIYGKNRSANDPGPALGIRADIDALPLEEANKFTHASKHKGCMHGCGHDGHTAMLMREIVGENNAHDNVLPAMTAEDFGFMLQEVPGAYGWIGNGNDALSQGDLHSTSYDFNDKNLELGALFWEKLARQWFITEVTHS